MRGFTLAELVISLAILGLILVGVSAALGLATSALPDERSRGRDALALALEQVRVDLDGATRLRSIDSKSVEVCLPDRNADGRADVLRHSWDGTEGSPLNRTLNAESDQLLGKAGNVGFTSQTWTRSTSVPITTQISAASTLGTAPADLGASATTQNFLPYTGYAQMVSPVLPAGSGVWTITHLRAMIRKLSNSGTDSERIVQIRLADDSGLPTSTVLYQAQMKDFSFSGDLSNWSTLAVSGMPYLLPTQRVCVCFINTGSDWVWQFDLKRATGSGSGMSATSNSGSTWAGVSNRSLFVSVDGTYVTPTTSVTLERTYTSSIGVELTDMLGQSLSASISLPNGCEVLADGWRTDFERNPTTQDVNGDGTPDWSMTSGSYADSDLSGGWLKAKKSMALSSAQDFTQPSEFATRLRITSSGQEWYGTVYADKSGGLGSKLTLRVDRTSAAVVRVRLYENWPFPATLLIDRSLSLDTLDLRCLVTPDKDVVTLYVNDALLGASGYTRSSLSLATPTPFIMYGTASTVLVDWVDVRVGGVTK
ncbi:MAG: prepilin-type N-terminal cleavage/methylation domain-containing protein [Phycisphaerales bacterium]|nr:prepilin-type N-terminal cleavage/methylation domain-containing protein [Phycisphaerales bacterium]